VRACRRSRRFLKASARPVKGGLRLAGANDDEVRKPPL
jgi:hypothetical protein